MIILTDLTSQLQSILVLQPHLIASLATQSFIGISPTARILAHTPALPQVALKNYDPQRDKRFSGTFKLPTIPRYVPRLQYAVIRDH